MIPPRPVIPPEDRAAFAQQIAAGTVTGLRICALLGVLLFPLFLGLDLAMFPEHLTALGVIRATTTLAGVALLGAVEFAARRGVAERRVGVFVAALLILYGTGLLALTVEVGGLGTPYYAGTNLLLLAMIASFPFGTRIMALALLFVVAQLNIGSALLAPGTPWGLVVNANFFLLSTVFVGLIITEVGHRLRVTAFLDHRRLQEERARSEKLLLNILPSEVAQELKSKGKVQARDIGDCTILFSDFVGFTGLSATAAPAHLVASLDAAFQEFDAIITRWGLEKLKTIGDAYMCAAGVVEQRPDHLVACVMAGLEMLEAMDEGSALAPDGSRWQMRVGVNSGPVVAGVIGTKKFAYDVWGDTVNVASRMESASLAGAVNLRTDLYQLIARYFEGEDRGALPVKGKEPMSMTLVRRLRPEYASDDAGRVPNAALLEAIDIELEERTIPA